MTTKLARDLKRKEPIRNQRRLDMGNNRSIGRSILELTINGCWHPVIQDECRIMNENADILI